MSRINAHNVGNPYTMVLVTLTTGLRAVPINPFKELTVAKEYLLIDALEEQAMVLHGPRRPNLKWKAQ